MNQVILSSRLKLRQWQISDLHPFANMNADPEVMRYFPATLTEDESKTLADRLHKLIDDNGFGFWAVELLATQEFIGFVGLNEIEADSELAQALNIALNIPLKMDTPFVEIGWRLAKEYWGQGYATESARAVLKFAFDELKVDAVYAFTAVINQPSQQVMQRIGMANTGQDFDHPKVPQGHELQRHCLWRIVNCKKG